MELELLKCLLFKPRDFNELRRTVPDTAKEKRSHNGLSTHDTYCRIVPSNLEFVVVYKNSHKTGPYLGLQFFLSSPALSNRYITIVSHALLNSLIFKGLTVQKLQLSGFRFMDPESEKMKTMKPNDQSTYAI